MDTIIETDHSLKYKILINGKILLENIISYDVAQVFLSSLEESVRNGAIVMAYTDSGKSLLMEGTA